MPLKPYTMFEEYQPHLDLLNNPAIPFIYLTGNAGTGKSTLINHFAETCGKKVVKLAPTGLAALRINGSTIHKFFSLSSSMPYFSPIDYGVMKVKNFDVLIIDEISMVRSDVMQVIYNSLTYADYPRQRPWGGKMVRVVGDLLQLPPVVNNKDINTAKYLNETYGGRFFFNAKCFSTIPMIVLEKVHRQTDERFVKMLNFMRQPDPKQSHSNYLLSEVNKLIRPAREESVVLCTVKAKVCQINSIKLSQITHPSTFFQATQTGDIGADRPADDIIELKKGCRVMLLANVDNYVNGSTGVYKGFCTKNKFYEDPMDSEEDFEEDDECNYLEGENILAKEDSNICLVVELDNGETAFVKPYLWSKIKYKDDGKGNLIRLSEASFVQFPVALAYAITIHKSQGLTLPAIHVDFGEYGCFDHGQAYVAFSRCKSLDGITLQFPVKQKDFRFDTSVYTTKLERVL